MPLLYPLRSSIRTTSLRQTASSGEKSQCPNGPLIRRTNGCGTWSLQTDLRGWTPTPNQRDHMIRIPHRPLRTVRLAAPSFPRRHCCDNAPSPRISPHPPSVRWVAQALVNHPTLDRVRLSCFTSQMTCEETFRTRGTLCGVFISSSSFLFIFGFTGLYVAMKDFSAFRVDSRSSMLFGVFGL